MITSPYNFVPLSEKVVMPFWAKYVSHDVPFKDAQSGTLNLKIKAENPIYVRNGASRNAPDKDKNTFNQFNNQYFIPGSSIRGMLRAVIEIMSFGRMKNKVNDDRYSVRDFQNVHLYDKTNISNTVKCGWLYKIGDEYFLDKCGKPVRIAHKNLDVLCKGTEKISTYYKKRENVSSDRDKSAKSKNEKFPFDRNQKFTLDYNSVGRAVYKIDSEGRDGEIVMTGQSSVRTEPTGQKPHGKHLEFVFWKTKPTKTPVPDKVIKNFFFAYYDHDKNNQKEDWQWRKSQLDNGKRIPVFYRTENGNLIDMGLTMLYKITYNNSVIDSIKNIQQNSDNYDLAETIFGYTDKDEVSLKSRVQVGHAFVCSGNVTPMSEQIAVLAGPKASYYPNYIEQDPKENGTVETYQTFMDNKAKIRGWKRYPIHNGDVKRNYPPEIKGRINDKIATKFIPLPKDTEFTFDIHYHNLRKEELGALISAITFHNLDGLFHSIGSAKPLGYGKITLNIEGGLSKTQQVTMMKSFETYMDYALNHSSPSWYKSSQIKEFLVMANPGNDDNLKYMDIADFANKKGKSTNDPHYALQKYSIVSKTNVTINPLTTESDLSTAKKIYQKEKETFAKLKTVKEATQILLISTEKKLCEEINTFKKVLLEKLEEKRKKQHRKEQSQNEIRQGINLNGVLKRKSVDGLLRVLKRWRNLGGEVDSSVAESIINRISILYSSMRSKEREKWLTEIDCNINRLKEYLSPKQISDIRNYLRQLNSQQKREGDTK